MLFGNERIFPRLLLNRLLSENSVGCCLVMIRKQLGMLFGNERKFSLAAAEPFIVRKQCGMLSGND
jgi:hypothetical protein